MWQLRIREVAEELGDRVKVTEYDTSYARLVEEYGIVVGAFVDRGAPF